MGFLRHTYDNDTSSNKLISANLSNEPASASSQSVFIIHGHDDSLIEEVKTCVTELGLSPIVLREQSNHGRTVIEKLESWLGNCKCAIVLYTPCDIGRAASEKAFENRARQNVVYEHGLFQGALGRKRTLVLKKGDTKFPGDCSGIVYISVDSNDWEETLRDNIEALNESRATFENI